MPATFQYWRVYVNGVTNGSSVVSLAEMSFRDANDSPISLSGGTASASSTFGGSAASNAFDGDPATFWASAANPSLGSPQWLQYQLASAQAVACIVLTVRNDAGAWTSQSPPTFLIQSSPDGSTWTTQNTVTGFNWNSNGQTAFFAASTSVGHASVSQVAVEVVKAGANARVSQITVEALANLSPNVKGSQMAIEAMINAQAHVKISQVMVEVMFPYIVPTPTFIQNFLLP